MWSGLLMTIDYQQSTYQKNKSFWEWMRDEAYRWLSDGRNVIRLNCAINVDGITNHIVEVGALVFSLARRPSWWRVGLLVGASALVLARRPSCWRVGLRVGASALLSTSIVSNKAGVVSFSTVMEVVDVIEVTEVLNHKRPRLSFQGSGPSYWFHSRV